MSDTIHVQAFHNLAPSFGGYAPGARMVRVFAADQPTTGDVAAVCDAVFMLLNIGDDPQFGTPDPRAVEYRARGNRSLSMGDVIALSCGPEADPDYYAISPAGFIPVGAPNIVTAACHGTTPLP